MKFFFIVIGSIEHNKLKNIHEKKSASLECFN